MISADGRSEIYPDLSVYNMEVSLSYINGLIGVSLEAEEVIISYNLLMQNVRRTLLLHIKWLVVILLSTLIRLEASIEFFPL